MKIEPFKMRVTPEQSRRVQEIIFKNGGEWRNGQTTVINTNRPCLAFDLHGDGDGISGWSNPSTGLPTFSDAEVPEITYDEFTNKYERQMKELKLEVGKTYRSRECEEVKITGFAEGIQYPYKGNKGKWYTESGQWCNKESPYDLIEELPEPRYTFTIPDDKEITVARYTLAIPDGMKEVVVSQVGSRIVVEMVPTAGPKPGDVMINDNGNVYIFKETVSKNTHRHYAWFGRNGRVVFNESAISGRPATPEEAQPLWDALKEAGKRWNPEAMQVEEIPEIDRIREWVEENLKTAHYSHAHLSMAINGYLKYREGEK